MVYQGRVENGVIVLDDSVRLPEGAEVQISLRELESPKTGSHRSIEEEIADIMLSQRANSCSMPTFRPRVLHQVAQHDGSDERGVRSAVFLSCVVDFLNDPGISRDHRAT